MPAEITSLPTCYRNSALDTSSLVDDAFLMLRETGSLQIVSRGSSASYVLAAETLAECSQSIPHALPGSTPRSAQTLCHQENEAAIPKPGRALIMSQARLKVSLVAWARTGHLSQASAR